MITGHVIQKRVTSSLWVQGGDKNEFKTGVGWEAARLDERYEKKAGERSFRRGPDFPHAFVFNTVHGAGGKRSMCGKKAVKTKRVVIGKQPMVTSREERGAASPARVGAAGGAPCKRIKERSREQARRGNKRNVHLKRQSQDAGCRAENLGSKQQRPSGTLNTYPERSRKSGEKSDGWGEG